MCVAGPAVAADATLIVDRREDSVALYFRTAASDFETIFGAGADALLAIDGTVDVPRLYDGTYLLADEIFATSTVQIGSDVVRFEALSMMVHDPEILPDFATPYDAELSIAVCTSPDTVANMGLSSLEGYLGYFAWKVDGFADMQISLPQTGRGALELRVRAYVDHVEVSDQTVILPDGGTLMLTAPRPVMRGFAVWLVVVVLCFAAVAAGMFWGGTQRPRTAT